MLCGREGAGSKSYRGSDVKMLAGRQLTLMELGGGGHEMLPEPDISTRVFKSLVLVGAVALTIAVIAIVYSFANGLDDEEFQRLADGVQKLAVTFAVIGGALWTLFTYSALHTRDRARAELLSLQTQLERQASVRISVAVEPFEFPGYYSNYARATVTIKNTGNRNTTLSQSASLAVAEVVPVGDDVAPLFYTAWSPIGKHAWASWHNEGGFSEPIPVLPTGSDYLLRAGMEIDVKFLVRLPGPGAYHIQFRTPLHRDELTRMHELGLAVDKAYWIGEQIIAVQSSQDRAVIGAPFRYSGSYPETLDACDSSLASVAAYLTRAKLEEPAVQPIVELCSQLADVRRLILFGSNNASVPGTVSRLLQHIESGQMVGIDLRVVDSALRRDQSGAAQAIRVSAVPSEVLKSDGDVQIT